jgi:hypothetical protein
LLKAVAALLWPAIVIILRISFRDSSRMLIKSAPSHKFTVKAGEMEVSMEDTTGSRVR